VRGAVKNLPGRSGLSYTTLLKLGVTEICITMCLDSSASQQDLEAGILKKIMQTYVL